jgi:hypothetical protein
MLVEFCVIHRRQLRQKPSNCLFSRKSGLRQPDHEFASPGTSIHALLAKAVKQTFSCGENSYLIDDNIDGDVFWGCQKAEAPLSRPSQWR